MESILSDWSQRIRASAASKRPLRLRGGGTKDFYGQDLEGEVFDTRGYSSIVAYEPSELVITARCGTRLADIETAMSEHGQMLAFGGQVMKNVAGYDVSRLMAGSLGTLGIILEVSLKVQPRPAAEATLRLELPEDKAIETLNKWGGKPLSISASAWMGGELGMRLSGAAAAVKSTREKIGGELVDAAQGERFWAGIREQTDPFFRNDAPLWRISVPSATPPLKLPGEPLIEWGGALRWLCSRADARTVRDAAKRARGHATLFRGGDKSVGAFQPLAPVLMKIHKELKREFDPQGIFNRGRMYPEL